MRTIIPKHIHIDPIFDEKTPKNDEKTPLFEIHNNFVIKSDLYDNEAVSLELEDLPF
jgi:hypothetical protein